jgi:outer membrane lipoprotein-sorting protein
MAADINFPADGKKYVLFTGGTVSVYAPGPGTITEYNAGKNKADFETFLVLGFGGRGHDLTKSFDVTYAGTEQVQGIKAEKLVLTPKSQKVANMFETITLWIDPARGISVQQLFKEGKFDYRLAKYNNIKLNEKLSNDVFKIKPKGKVTYVRPNS